MPPKGYKVITIKETLFDQLKEIGDQLDPKRGIPETIEYLLSIRKIKTSYANFHKFKGLGLFTSKSPNHSES